MATSDEELTVWIGGLDAQVTTEILWELFVQAGPLLDVKLPVDRETGEQRNFAFIAYKHPISGPYAERLFNGTQLFEKTIRVRYKGSQKFDQNKYHELYEKLLERLVVDNPSKYADVFDQIEAAKAGYAGNRIVYDEEEQFAGYNSSRDYNNNNNTSQGYNNNNNSSRDYNNNRDNNNSRSYDRSYNDRSGYERRNNQSSHDDRSQDRSRDTRHKPYNRNSDDSYYRQRGSRF